LYTYSTPINPDWNDPWSILINPGIIEYLIVEPISELSGTYRWTTNLTEAKSNAQKYYPNTEGTDRHGSRLYFVTKTKKRIFILDLDDNTYTVQSTQHGLFAGGADQIVHITDTDDSLLYFTEDGGQFAGVHARDRSGEFYTILEGTSTFSDETTGLSFSPDGKHLYVAYQDEGVLLDVTRIDGLPFDGTTLNVKYHLDKIA
jgi:DNA-binding beta-propeller fold protein YncE